MSDPSKTSSLWTLLVHVEDFFGEDKFLASKLIAVARWVGGALSESACKPIDPGVGDGGWEPPEIQLFLTLGII